MSPPLSWALAKEVKPLRTRTLAMSAHPDGVTGALVIKKDVSWPRCIMRPVCLSPRSIPGTPESPKLQCLTLPTLPAYGDPVSLYFLDLPLWLPTIWKPACLVAPSVHLTKEQSFTCRTSRPLPLRCKHHPPSKQTPAMSLAARAPPASPAPSPSSGASLYNWVPSLPHPACPSSLLLPTSLRGWGPI